MQHKQYIQRIHSIDMQKTQLKLTVDRIEDPEEITKYTIIRTVNGQVLAKGRYLYLFGFRIGLHISYNKTMRLVA